MHDDVLSHAKVSSKIACITLVGTSLVMIDNNCIRICSSTRVLFEVIQLIVPYIKVFQLWSASSRPDADLVKDQPNNSNVQNALKVTDDLMQITTKWFIDNRRHAGLPTKDLAAALDASDTESESNDSDNDSDDASQANVNELNEESACNDSDDNDVVSDMAEGEKSAPGRSQQQGKRPKKLKPVDQFALTKSDGTLGTVTNQFAKALHRTFRGLTYLFDINPEFPVHLISTLRLENLFGTMRQNVGSTMYPTALEYIEHYSSATAEYIKKTSGTSFYLKTHRKSRRYQKQLDGSYLRYDNNIGLPRKQRGKNADALDDDDSMSSLDMPQAKQLQDKFRHALWTYLRIFGKPAKSNRIRAFSKHAAGTLPDNATYFHRDGGQRRATQQPDLESDGESDATSVSLGHTKNNPPVLNATNHNQIRPTISPAVANRAVAKKPSTKPTLHTNTPMTPTIGVRASTPTMNAATSQKRRGRPPKVSNDTDSVASRTSSVMASSTMVKHRGRPRKNRLPTDAEDANELTDKTPPSTSRVRKRRSPNRQIPVNETVYRRFSIVQDRAGNLYKLRGIVYRAAGQKTLKPVEVQSHALVSKNTESTTISTAEWVLSNSLVALRTGNIVREVHDIDVTSRGSYIRQVQHSSVLLRETKTRQSDDEQDEVDGEKSSRDDESEEEPDDELSDPERSGSASDGEEHDAHV